MTVTWFCFSLTKSYNCWGVDVGVFFRVCRGFGVFQACVGVFLFYISNWDWGTTFWMANPGGPGSFGDCCFRSDHIWWEIWNYVIIVIRGHHAPAPAHALSADALSSVPVSELWHLFSLTKKLHNNEHKVWYNDVRVLLVFFFLK